MKQQWATLMELPERGEGRKPLGRKNAIDALTEGSVTLVFWRTKVLLRAMISAFRLSR